MSTRILEVSFRTTRTSLCRRSLIILLALASLCAPHVTGAAQDDKKARVADSILDIKIGMSLEEAREKLKKLGTYGGRDTRDGGRKEAWTLKKSKFSSVAYQTDGKGRVKWVTGYVRPGKEIRFEELGTLAQALRNTEHEAIWNVERPEGNYRLIAKGVGGRAGVVQLLSLALAPMQ